MADMKMMGAAAGGAGSVLGDVTRKQFPNKLEVGGFDLTPHIGAAVGGLAGGMVAGGKDYLKLAAVGVAGDAAGLLVQTVVPQLPAVTVADISITKGLAGAGVGYFLLPAL